MVLCVKTSRKDAQKVKHYLLENTLFVEGYVYQKDETHVWFPTTKEFTLENIKLSFEDIDLKISKKQPSFKEAAQEILTKDEGLLARLAYDSVGSIAIIEIVPELEAKGKELAQLLLDTNKHIETVLKKGDGHIGEFRVQPMIYLAGKNTKETIVHETGVRLKVNVESVYYSVRFGTERKRIMELIQPDEEILCMFSGAGPYPIVFAKNTQAKNIVGIEINPEGHKYALENLKLNKIKNVELHCGDVNAIKLKQTFNRITMPLPHTAEEFLPTAVTLIKPKGTIHLYAFAKKEDFDSEKERIKHVVETLGKTVKDISVHPCGQHSPYTFRVCYDIVVC